MGSFAVSFHVKANDARRVAKAARAALKAQGYGTADQRPDADFDWAGGGNTRALRVAEAHDGWVGVLDTAVGEDCDLAQILSRDLKTDAIHVMVNDSDSWLYQLFQNGAAVDSFDSMGEEDEGGEGSWNASDDDDGSDDAALDMNAMMQAQRQDVQALSARLDDLLPPEMRDIKARMAVNTATMEESQRFMSWFQQNSGQVLSQLMRGGGLPMLNPLMDGGAGGGGTLTAAPDTARLREHLRRLRPFLHDGVGDELVLAVFGHQTIFAEETLARFLPLLGISETYAQLNYRYLDEMEQEELADSGVQFVEHLKFVRA